jgi:replicative DNA helicase
VADGGGRRESALFGLSQRIPPNNVQAEQSLLGALLANNRAFERVAEYLRPIHFADPIHGRIYQHITEKILDGRLADAVTLKVDFEHSGILDEVGGTAYLAQLLASMVSVNSAGEYGRAVHDAWMRRQLIEIGETMINNAFGADPELNGAAQINEAERSLTILAANGREVQQVVQAGKALAWAIARADDVHRTGVVPGVRFGIPTIDRALDGLIDRDTLTLLGGLPASGKTALIGQMGKSLGLRVYDEAIARGLTPEQAMKQPGMLLLSLEMTAEQIGLRLASHEAGINSDDLRNGRMDEISVANLIRAEARTKYMAFRIHPLIGAQVRLLPQKIAMHLRRQPELLVVIDNLLTRGATEEDTGRGRRNGLDASTVSWLTGQLKALSTATGVPMVALTHLPRPQAGVVRRPVAQDVKWAGEGDADNVVFVHRPYQHIESSPPPQGPREGEDRYHARKEKWYQERKASAEVAEIIVAKQRQGPGGVFRMRWHGPTTSFREWDMAEPSPDLSTNW